MVRALSHWADGDTQLIQIVEKLQSVMLQNRMTALKGIDDRLYRKFRETFDQIGEVANGE